jgi:hypothetical protein
MCKIFFRRIGAEKTLVGGLTLPLTVAAADSRLYSRNRRTTMALWKAMPTIP